MKLRSLLYVPASEERFIAKAHSRGADGIILDLEDGVAHGDKDMARSRLAASIARVGQSGATVFVRINADIGTVKQDAAAAFLGGAFGVVVAKANPKKVSDLNAFLDEIASGQSGRGLRLVPLIEDAAALLAAQEISLQPRVFALMLGGEDFAASIGAAPDPDVLRVPKLMVHYAAKSQGLLSFGMFMTVADFADTGAIAAAAKEAKRFGFDGATCVHPSAVSPLNAAFSPTLQEVGWAQRVLEHAGKSEKAAFVFEGQMVDAPVLARARRIRAQS